MLLNISNIRKHIYRHKANDLGFTLVELSIVLIIIGVLVSGALSLATSRTSNAQITNTINKIERIEGELSAYVMLNRRLPCPADGTVSGADAEFGLEKRDSSDPTDCDAALMPSSSTNIAVGVVPVRSLNLPDSFMMDGWNQRILYVVDVRYVNESDFMSNNTGAIQVLSAASSGVVLTANPTGSAENSGAIYLIMSYGMNSHGAWPFDGGTNRNDTASTDADEIENAHNVTNFNSIDNVFVSHLETANFDDIVRFKLKHQLISLAGGILSSSVCDLAERTLLPRRDAAPDEGPVGCNTSSNLDLSKCINRQKLLAEAVQGVCLSGIDYY